VYLAAVAVSIDGDFARSQPADDDDDAAGSGSAIVAPSHPGARAGWVQEQFGLAIKKRPTLGKTRIGYYALDVTTGAVIASQDADKGLNLASNAKVLTSAAALSALGSGFRWRTSVHAMTAPDKQGTIAGDLYVKGRGDPMLTVGDLRQLAHEVAARGVHVVEGKLVVDATYFDTSFEPPHFNEQPNERAAFRAPVASFGVNRSMYTVTVLAVPGKDARVTIEPAIEYLKLTKDEVTSVDEGRTKLRLDAKPKPNQISLELSGQIRNGQGSWDLRRRVDDPARFAAEVFAKALADQGIKVRGRAIAFGTVPANARLIASHDSMTLADVLRPMNKWSDNYIAESVLKTMGAELKGAPNATWADGVDAMRKHLAKIGMAGQFRSENGSGLFSSTEVSEKQLVSLLVAAHKDYRIGPDLVASFPVGGLDGTLARRWKGRAVQGRVRAKTGTLDRVKTLAGYVAVDGQRLVAFAILANDIPAGQRGVVGAMADEMVEALGAYLDAR
jgi:D-alanyl-D-alanine carboxypeptidase/D-alanyl-D-alanine-endopeptidase (penicillin-binding protein 4)